MKAEWKIKGIYNADPTAVAEEISELPEEGNTAERMVERARDEHSAMHNLFEWNDSIAGQKYRIHQAHGILRTLVLVREEPQKQEKPVRFFLSTGNREGTYKQTVKMVQNIDEYEKVLQQAKAELINFKAKYHSLLEFQELFKVIDEVV